MALTLPHDLVFTPLDVLTAEEMNDLMDDLNYISNQFPLASSNIANSSIGSLQLASSAVTPAKVSFADFIFSANIAGIDNFSATTGWTKTVLKTQRVYVSPGTYQILACCPYCGPGTDGDSEFILRATPSNGTVAQMGQYSGVLLTGSTWNFKVTTSGAYIDLAAVYNGTQTTNGRWGDIEITLIRIG